MSQTDHSLVEVEDGSTTIYRCEDCGLNYQNKSTFEMYRCSPMYERGEDKTDLPPESSDFE